LHPLAGINQQQGTLASSQAAGHLQIGSGTAAAAATAQQQQQQQRHSSSSSGTAAAAAAAPLLANIP
jgi:hypothetical protein